MQTETNLEPRPRATDILVLRVGLAPASEAIRQVVVAFDLCVALDLAPASEAIRQDVAITTGPRRGAEAYTPSNVELLRCS